MTIVSRGLELYIKLGSWHCSISHLAFCSRKHLLNSDNLRHCAWKIFTTCIWT